ncbi:MAG TPA: hypothetical protein VF678_08450 [bacterium]
MPITYEIDAALRLIKSRFSGDVSITDLRGFVIGVHSDPAFGTDLQSLVHLENVQARFNAADLMEYQDWRKRRPPIGRMAIVATTDHEFGIARQFELATNAAGGTELRVFRQPEKAREWLGMPLAP